MHQYAQKCETRGISREWAGSLTMAVTTVLLERLTAPKNSFKSIA